MPTTPVLSLFSLKSACLCVGGCAHVFGVSFAAFAPQVQPHVYRLAPPSALAAAQLDKPVHQPRCASGGPMGLGRPPPMRRKQPAARTRALLTPATTATRAHPSTGPWSCGKAFPAVAGPNTPRRTCTPPVTECGTQLSVSRESGPPAPRPLCAESNCTCHQGNFNAGYDDTNVNSLQAARIRDRLAARVRGAAKAEAPASEHGRRSMCRNFAATSQSLGGATTGAWAGAAVAGVLPPRAAGVVDAATGEVPTLSVAVERESWRSVVPDTAGFGKRGLCVRAGGGLPSRRLSVIVGRPVDSHRS